jgi:hypothetical protein
LYLPEAARSRESYCDIGYNWRYKQYIVSWISCWLSYYANYYKLYFIQLFLKFYFIKSTNI